MTKSRVLYMAEPIDQSDFGAWKESVQTFVKIATTRGWLVFRPASAWKIEPSKAPVGPEIEVVNRQVMGISGAVVAFLPLGVPTVGVPREVEWARAHNTPVLVVTEKAGWSLHDVMTCDLDDAPSFGTWIKAVEESPVKPGGPMVFQVGPNGVLPSRAHSGDAGYDLYVSEDTVIPPGQFIDVPCDLRVALPSGVWARITGRSSTLRKRGLLVAEGIIDNGYRGPLYAGVRNLEQRTVRVAKGDRIAQLILHENTTSGYEPVSVDPGMFERIPGDTRGVAGFGSSGD